MNRLRYSLMTAVCLIVPASAVRSAPVPAARSGLEQVPDKAPIVIHLRGVQGTRDRLVTMMTNALPDVLKKFQKEMDDFLENGHEGRKIRGLSKDGPIFLAFTDLPKPGDSATPPIAVIVAVSSYTKFLEGILTEDERKGMTDKGDGIQAATLERETTYFLDRKGYAVVTPNEEVAKSFAKKFTGLDTKMSKELSAKLLASDLGVYVNMDGVNSQYAEEIKKAKEGIEQLMTLGAAGGDESQKKIVELAKKAIDPIFQAIEDMHAVVATVEMRPSGLALHVQSEIKESSTTANLLQDSRPVEFKELNNLPRNRDYYYGIKASAALYKNLGNLMAGLPSGGTPDTGAFMEELAKAGPEMILSGGGFPLSGLTVSRFQDPAKAVAANLKYYRTLDPKAANLKHKPKIESDAKQFGDFKLHYVQLAWDLDKMAEPAAKGNDDAKKAAIEAMKGFLGEKMSLWIGTDGKTVVQVIASDWSAAEKLLDQYSKGKGTVGEVKAFLDVRKEMPKRASFLAAVDATHMFGTILEVVKPMMPPGVALPPGWPNMPAKDTSSYVGVSARLQPGRGSFDLFISAAAAQEFYKAVIKPFVGE